MVMTYIRAKWQHTGRRGKSPRVIVIHCTVSPESGTGAEAVARYFQRGERRASAHRVSDNNSTVMCVPDENTAFGAAGVNNDGLHLELCGYPDQTRTQWLDAYSQAMLDEATPTIREWAAEFKIPLRWLTVAQVADGVTRGLCTHHDASLAFPEVSTGHWDPGPNFPKDVALRIWSGTSTSPVPRPPSITQEFPMFFARQVNTLEVYLFEQGRYTHIKSRADLTAIAKNAGISPLEAELGADTMAVLKRGRVVFR